MVGRDPDWEVATLWPRAGPCPLPVPPRRRTLACQGHPGRHTVSPRGVAPQAAAGSAGRPPAVGGRTASPRPEYGLHTTWSLTVRRPRLWRRRRFGFRHSLRWLLRRGVVSRSSCVGVRPTMDVLGAVRPALPGLACLPALAAVLASSVAGLVLQTAWSAGLGAEFAVAMAVGVGGLSYSLTVGCSANVAGDGPHRSFRVPRGRENHSSGKPDKLKNKAPYYPTAASTPRLVFHAGTC